MSNQSMGKIPLVHTSIKKEAMLRSLRANFGRVTKAANAIQITRQTHYNWYKEDEEYRNQVDNIKYESYDAFGDLVFDTVIKKLTEGNTSVANRCFQTMFSRWAEHMEVTNPFKTRLVARIKYTDKPTHDAT